MNKSIFLILFVLFFSYPLLAQQQINILNAFQQCKLKAYNDYNDLLFLVHNSMEKDVIGKTYLDDWAEAFLVTDEEKIYSVTARYRLFDDEFQILMDEQAKAVYPNLIKGIVFKNKVFVSGTQMKEDGPFHGFYELISEGEIALLKKYVLDYKVIKNGMIKTGDLNEILYYCDGEDFVKEVSSSNTKLLHIFGAQQAIMKIYFKEQNLSSNNTSDLKILFDYYNREIVNQ